MCTHLGGGGGCSSGHTNVCGKVHAACFWTNSRRLPSGASASSGVLERNEGEYGVGEYVRVQRGGIFVNVNLCKCM